jgi:hypothetical protein
MTHPPVLLFGIAAVVAICATLSSSAQSSPSTPQSFDWIQAKFGGNPKLETLLWRWDHDLRYTFVHDLFEQNDLQGQSREAIYHLLGSPDRIIGKAESYDIPYGSHSTATTVLTLDYLAGIVCGWRLEIRPHNSCGWVTEWCTSPRPVAWYLNGSRKKYPVLSVLVLRNNDMEAWIETVKSGHLFKPTIDENGEPIEDESK